MRPKTRRVPRALLAGSPRAEVKAVAEVSDGGPQIQLPTGSNEDRQPDCDDIVKTVEPQIEVQQDLTDVREAKSLEVVLLEGEPQIQTLDNNITSSVLEASNHAAPADSLLVTNPPTTLTEKTALYIQARAQAAPAIITPGGIGLGLLVPSTSTKELRLLSPLESRCASPKPEFEPPRTYRPPAPRSSSSPHAELRANLVRKVAAFTATRISRVPSVSPPLRPTHLDDPFAETCAATPRAPFVPAHPAVLRYRGQQFRFDQEQSPTPQPRPGRPPLRQQTVFFKQVTPRAETPPPEFWAPHPAGSRSCAILIKAPPVTSTSRVAADKENQAI
ncbi:hypothetical protein B0H19DRAFT_1198370 [Mycena capillaripes]|nr:hypothetical protein B0H19DRAFT_1198370 [Mycena capillaripes]